MLKKFLVMMGIMAALAAVGTVADAKTESAAPLEVKLVKNADQPKQAAAISKTETRSTDEEKVVKKPDFKDKRIEINLASRLLTLYQGDVGIRMYPIAPGKPSSPTPQGRRTVVDMEKNPTWTDPDSGASIPSGPDCPLGYRWIGIGGNYGIHGTNAPWAIGSYASHGCVRMQEKDVEDLYDHIVMGIPVDIIYERAVVEETPDHTVVYYIYPDGYGIEPLTVSDVEKKLEAFGVGNFASTDSIQAAINAQDGSPNYVAKVYPLTVKGKKLAAKAMGKDGHVYVPAMTVAWASGVKVQWSPNWNRLTTDKGQAQGLLKGRIVYVDAADAEKLFGLTGKLTEDGQYVME